MSNGKVDWVSMSVVVGGKRQLEVAEWFDTMTSLRKMETASSIVRIGIAISIIVVEIKIMIPSIDVVTNTLKAMKAYIVFGECHVHNLDNDGWVINECSPKCRCGTVARVEVNRAMRETVSP